MYLSARAVQKYLNKVSGPLLDRIDLHVEVTPVAFAELSQVQPGEDSETIRKRVIKPGRFRPEDLNMSRAFMPMHK